MTRLPFGVCSSLWRLLCCSVPEQDVSEFWAVASFNLPHSPPGVPPRGSPEPPSPATWGPCIHLPGWTRVASARGQPPGQPRTPTSSSNPRAPVYRAPSPFQGQGEGLVLLRLIPSPLSSVPFHLARQDSEAGLSLLSCKTTCPGGSASWISVLSQLWVHAVSGHQELLVRQVTRP